MIFVKDLTFSYTRTASFLFPDFSLSQGEHCLLLGESGSGKTTLLHLLGGLLRNYTGTLSVADTEIALLSESKLDLFRGKNIGFVFQKNHLITSLTVEKNLALASYLSGRAVQADRIIKLLEQLNLKEQLKSKVTAISQGQAQRVAIARAVLNNPSVILADEPTASLDDKNCSHVIDLLLRMAKENNASLLIATHDQRLKNKISKHIHLINK